MKNLHQYFQNPFAHASTSLGNWLAFTTHHLAELSVNNPGGIYDARIAATKVALAAVNSAEVDDSMKLGGRKSAKGEKRAFRQALPAAISKIYLPLAAKFGLRAAELKTFFPSGSSVFTQCRDAILEDELGVLIDALTKYQAVLGPDLLAAATDLRTRWRSLYAESGSATGAKAHTEKMKADARKALQHELFLNLLTLAQNFPDQPEKLHQFMQQSLLQRHSRTAQP